MDVERTCSWRRHLLPKCWMQALLSEHPPRCQCLCRRSRSHLRTGWGIPRFCSLLGTEPICPVSDEFLGQMCSIPVSAPEPEKLQRHLFEQYSIEIPVMRQDGRIFLRFSVNGFNNEADLDRLYAALTEIMQATNLLRSMGASRWDQFRYVRLPGALPSFFTALRIGITYAVTGAIFAEYVGATAGLGIFMNLQKNSFRTDLVLAAVVVTALISVALFALTHVVERLVIPWHRRG